MLPIPSARASAALLFACVSIFGAVAHADDALYSSPPPSNSTSQLPSPSPSPLSIPDESVDPITVDSAGAPQLLTIHTPDRTITCTTPCGFAAEPGEIEITSRGEGMLTMARSIRLRSSYARIVLPVPSTPLYRLGMAMRIVGVLSLGYTLCAWLVGFWGSGHGPLLISALVAGVAGGGIGIGGLFVQQRGEGYVQISPHGAGRARLLFGAAPVTGGGGIVLNTSF